MEARREAGPGALVAWWPRAPGSPVPPPSPASESPCFQLACTGMSRSSAFACSCGRGFCSDGADCGDPLAGGFANFIQFGPIAARDRGAVGSSLFNLSFSCRPVPVSPHRALIQPSRRPSCPGRPCFFFLLDQKGDLRQKQRLSSKRRWSSHSFARTDQAGIPESRGAWAKKYSPRSHTDSPAGLPRQIRVCKRATFPTEEAFPRLKVGALFRRVSGCFIS